jgi:uncharacterized protein YeaO (DUF488 family)
MSADATPTVLTGSVYRPPDAPQPRVLVMRRWPRGIRKDAVDHWMRDLAPSDPLLAAYLADELPWEGFAERYEAELATRPEALAEVVEVARTSGVTLLCGSHPEDRCHRTLLAAHVESELARSGKRRPRRAPRS